MGPPNFSVNQPIPKLIFSTLSEDNKMIASDMERIANVHKSAMMNLVKSHVATMNQLADTIRFVNEETDNFTKNQILQDGALAMLGQAHSSR